MPRPGPKRAEALPPTLQRFLAYPHMGVTTRSRNQHPNLSLPNTEQHLGFGLFHDSPSQCVHHINRPPEQPWQKKKDQHAQICQGHNLGARGRRKQQETHRSAVVDSSIASLAIDDIRVLCVVSGAWLLEFISPRAFPFLFFATAVCVAAASGVTYVSRGVSPRFGRPS